MKRKIVFLIIFFCTVCVSQTGQAHEPLRLISLAPSVILSQIDGLSVEISDGVTDGCMKWPTGVLQTAEDELAQTELHKPQDTRVLQIVANGYAEPGTNLCFVNVDLIIDELADVYFESETRVYSAFVRFDVWRTSFMVSGPRESMQPEIQDRVRRAVLALIADIERSKSIVQTSDEAYSSDLSDIVTK